MATRRRKAPSKRSKKTPRPKKTAKAKRAAKRPTTKKPAKSSKKAATKKKATAKAAKATKTVARLAETLRAFALALPGAYEDYPWGERVAKVKKKVFVFFGAGLSMSVKLPLSNDAALAPPFAEPTGYGLGKSGWVSITYPTSQALPVEMMQAWIEESYRSIAPKKLIQELDARG